MGRALFAWPSLEKSTGAASVTVSAVDSTYPATNLLNADPAYVAKANSTTATFQFYFGSAVTPVLVGAINHNWHTASLVTFGNSVMGVINSIPIPSRTEDGQCEHPYRTISGASVANSMFFVSVFAASSPVALGNFPMVSSYAAVPMKWNGGDGVEFTHEHLITTPGETFYGSELIYDKGVRRRGLSGLSPREDGRSLLHAAFVAAKGRNVPFLLVPDSDKTTCLWVKWDSTTFRFLRAGTNVTRTDVSVREMSTGLPL
jgi:hypothetical protein